MPLKSLGDGAVRLFGVALALANSQNGFLLIDEVENGIHHQGFAEASRECSDIGSALVRVVRQDGEAWAIEYSEKDLSIAAEQAIEVR